LRTKTVCLRLNMSSVDSSKNIVVYGSLVGVLEHLASLAPRTVLDYKQYFHNPHVANTMLMSNVYLKGSQRFFKGIVPSLSGVALAHIGLFSCLERSKREQEEWKVASYGILGKTLHDICVIPGDNVRMRSNMKDCSTMEAMRSIYTTKGLRGFFSGISASLAMNIPAGAIEFVVMNMCMKKFGDDGVKPFVYGGLAGICSNVIVSPIDTVKTFVQMHPTRQVNMEKIIRELLEQRGIQGFFRGMMLRTVSASLSYGSFVFLSKQWNLDIEH
jgi:hypothetical protein